VRSRLLAFVGTAVVLTVSNNFFGDQSAGCRGVNRSSGASPRRSLHFCKVLKCQVSRDVSHQLASYILWYAKWSASTAERSGSGRVCTNNEPAKKRLYDYDYDYDYAYETTYGLCTTSSVPLHACSALVSRKRRALGAVVSRNRNICSEFLLNVITYCVLINYLRRPGNVAGDFPRPRYFGVTYALSILVPCGFSYWVCTCTSSLILAEQGGSNCQ